MVKKINAIALSIKKLLERGLKQIEIARILGIKRQNVYYWAHTEIKNVQKRRKKLSENYIDKIYQIAANKTTSEASSRKIQGIINQQLKNDRVLNKKNRQLSITHATISRYLRKKFGRPRKIRKVFFLTKEQKKKRLEYCDMILKKGINGKKILFTDESKIDLCPFTNDSIRLTPENKNKLKLKDPKAYELINRQSRKFEKSIMIAGGISYFGLSKIILLEGTLNDFAYGQSLLFFKDDIENINKKFGVKLIFEQDGAKAHTSKANLNLIESLFSEDGWLQNPPNSPDLASPIENLWGILKPRIKRKNPQSLEELRNYTLQEWNSVPDNMVRKLCEGFLKRVKKIKELNGERLEPEHLREIGDNNIAHYNWELQEELPKIRKVYNDEQLSKYRKKEIANLKKEKKRLRTFYIKKIKESRKNMKNARGRTLGIALSILNAPQKNKEERDKKSKEIDDKIKSISKMNIEEYLKHINQRKKEDEEEERSISTIDEIIEQKLSKLNKFIEQKKEINYKINF